MPPGDGDDCRRTLRRLELEAYSSAMTALRAQGELGADARRLLAALRRTLRIGDDRHRAESRRVSNDALLSEIAERLSGPNAGLEWAREGRRQVPIVPRDAPHTAYRAIADAAARRARMENGHVSQTDEPEETDHEGPYEGPPVVTTDRSAEIAAEGLPRKKSRTDATPAMRRSAPQKHPDLSRIYTDYAKPHSGKKSRARSPPYRLADDATPIPRARNAHARLPKTPKQGGVARGSPQRRATPNAKRNSKSTPRAPRRQIDHARPAPAEGPATPSESRTPHQQDGSPAPAETAPRPEPEPRERNTLARPPGDAARRLVVKRRSDGAEVARTPRGVPASEETVRKIAKTSDIGGARRPDAPPRAADAATSADARPPVEASLRNPSASGPTTPILAEAEPRACPVAVEPRPTTKAFVLDSKSGRKMVVVPAKNPKAVTVQTMPVLQMKPLQGGPAPVKLVALGGAGVARPKTGNVALLSRSIGATAFGTPTKIISKDSLNRIRSAPFAEEGGVARVFPHLQVLPRMSPQGARLPTAGRGNVIVVQKGAAPPRRPPAPIVGDDASAKIPVSRIVERAPRPESFSVFLENDTSEGSPLRADEAKTAQGTLVTDDALTFRADDAEPSVHRVTDASLVGETPKSIADADDPRRVIHAVPSPNYADWEIELVDSAKSEISKMDDLNMEAEATSGSEPDEFVRRQTVRVSEKDSSRDESQFDDRGDTNEMFAQHSSVSKTLLSQLRDEGSSSNDSSFVLTKTLDHSQLELLDSSQTSGSAME